MKISVIDKQRSGIILQFAEAIGATIRGRFIFIPENKGGGYLTGFNWGADLRMMIRNYHLHEDIVLERTNELAEGQEDVIILLSGVFQNQSDNALLAEQANVLVCKHTVSSVLSMPSHTAFSSITIAVSKQYLNGMFGHIDHPIVAGILDAKDNFIFETSISTQIIDTASEMLQSLVPEIMEDQYYKLKCNELLFYVFSLVMQRDALPMSTMHIEDIKAIYAIKLHLQTHLEEPPNIALLARDAGMSEPKLRKLFKQTFGKGVFEYYQSARMQQAARLLKEKHLTVSEVGYQMGFTNLSHFSRVFEQHIGMKPKKYSTM